jgi:hypothetical protein
MDSLVHKQARPLLVENKENSIDTKTEYHFHKYLNRVKAIMDGTDTKNKPTKVM